MPILAVNALAVNVLAISSVSKGVSHFVVVLCIFRWTGHSSPRSVLFEVREAPQRRGRRRPAPELRRL